MTDVSAHSCEIGTSSRQPNVLMRGMEPLEVDLGSEVGSPLRSHSGAEEGEALCGDELLPR